MRNNNNNLMVAEKIFLVNHSKKYPDEHYHSSIFSPYIKKHNCFTEGNSAWIRNILGCSNTILQTQWTNSLRRGMYPKSFLHMAKGECCCMRGFFALLRHVVPYSSLMVIEVSDLKMRIKPWINPVNIVVRSE